MFFTQLLHTGQVALCAYGAYVSYIAISNLQQYEETSKKAAKYSTEAEHQLHKTRTTQSSGSVCVSSFQYAMRSNWRKPCTDSFLQILASLIAATTLSLAPGNLLQIIWTQPISSILRGHANGESGVKVQALSGK